MSAPKLSANYRPRTGDVRILAENGSQLSAIDVPLLDVPDLIAQLLRAYNVEAIAEVLQRSAR